MNAAGPGSSLPALRPQDQSFMPDVAAPLVADPYGARPPLGLRLSDLLITLRLRWMPLLAAFCLPVALGIGGAMLLKPRFTADSVLMVLLNRESTTVQDVSGIGPSVVSVELLRVVRGEAEILGSDDVLRRALRRVGIGTLFPELKPPPATGGSTPEEMEMAAAVDAFRRVLAVEADTNANILRARVTLPDRALAIQALAAVVDSYVERRGEMYSDENSRLLSAELSRYSDRLRQTEAEIAALRDQYGVLDIGQEMSLTATRLDNIRQRQDGLREQQVTAEAQLAAAQQRLGAEPDRVFASQEATNLAPNDDSRNQLARLLLERERMARQYNPDYPPLREMEGRIAAARAAIRESTRATYSTTRQVRNPNLELLNQRVVTLEVEADALKRQGEELARQRTELEARRTELVQADTRLRALQRAREGMEAVTRQLTTREAATRMEEDARRQRGNTITVVQPATAPLEGRGIRRLVALGGVAGGIALAAGLALLLTLTRRVFATPAEAERGLSLPALASFGVLPPARDAAPVPEVADLVALLLDARVNRRRPCLVQFVSAGGDDGGDVLARAVALEYARRNNTDTLLIDLRTDGAAHLAALGSEPREVEERVPGNVLVFSTAVPNLWVSFDAAHSHLTDPMATQEQTLNLLAQLRQAFDAVVVIGPQGDESYPMRRLTSLMDLNLIVVRGERTIGSRARALRDWVLGAGGTLLGFVYTGQRRVLPPILSRML
ncbi:hypothetical protein EBE87_02200 [Pseudoroseomonas wenyumeiae]|uniref:Lipopolysaccharide biosynthesis protein n=3 Tax=Teichococcus wenyumeiae TaxID=2478470 RepID=A0ABX9VSI4_9PROT|nr:hypothetical protein [Pseudoroseomonas wenyumeiae]RMI27203.1 hypothetical protein EBE87_02200 [Pseudoroseomonas wenyumeiae]